MGWLIIYSLFATFLWCMLTKNYENPLTNVKDKVGPFIETVFY